MSELLHGTTGGYTNHGCRCEPCRQAWRDYCWQYRQALAKAQPPARVHGTVNGYSNWGCRCEACRRVKRERDAARYRRRVGA